MPVEEIELDGETKFRAFCDKCGEFSVVKENRIAAERSLAGHAKGCKKGNEEQESSEEQPEYVRELEVVKEALKHYITGKDKGIKDILAIIRTKPRYLDSPLELEQLLLAKGIVKKQAIHNVVRDIFEELNPEALGLSRGYRQPGAREGIMTIAKYQEIRRQERLEDENKRLREKLAEKGSSGTSDEVWKEREARMKAEFGLLVNQSTTEKYNQGYREGRAEKIGKTTLDVISELGTKFDERVEQMMIRTAKFNPDKKYSPKQRKEKAKQISEKLEKKEEILEAENALIVSAHKMMTERSNKHD